MSEQIAGVIDSIYTKTVKTKRGDGQVYHAMVNGHDVNLGFKCDYVEGEAVTLEVEHKYGGYQLINGRKGSVAGASNGTGTTSPNPATPRRAAPAEFPVPKNTKGITIARQNSGGHAATIVAAMIETGQITTVDDAADAFMTLAYQITDFATGQREQAQAEAIANYQAQGE
jgi:hypothetical protein